MAMFRNGHAMCVEGLLQRLPRCEQTAMFNLNRLLIDPYAKQLVGSLLGP